MLNALVGQKVSITSDKAQTTRHRITGRLNAFRTLANNPGLTRGVFEVLEAARQAGSRLVTRPRSTRISDVTTIASTGAKNAPPVFDLLWISAASRGFVASDETGLCRSFVRVRDGIRTRDLPDHNRGL